MNGPVRLAPNVFVGRERELQTLQAALHEACAGRGRLVMLLGDAGIGKTRTAEEFAGIARRQDVLVLRGACHEGEWAPPYGPFAEAITEYARGANAGQLRQDLGSGCGPIARLVPALRGQISDVPEPTPLHPDEERYRLLDAVCQFLIALSVRMPLLLVLDDLSWADKGTIAMLRHVAWFAPRHRILLLGVYRDVELDCQPPLVDALGALRRETIYEPIQLKGLETHEVGRLLETLVDQAVPGALVTAIARETAGNPFFIREVLLHLVEERRIFGPGEYGVSSLTIEEMGIPEGIRQVIRRRVSRLAEQTHQFLTVAAAFNGVFRFDVAAAVVGLGEGQGLDAVEEALSAQLLRPGSAPDTYNFTHTLIRHALYAEVSPSRRTRLHRQIAETLERIYGDRVVEHAAEVAYQYHRSAGLPGAERGVGHALAAADQAEAAYAWEQVVTYLRTAIGMLPSGSAHYPRLLARLGLALPWVFAFDAAVDIAGQAGRLLAESESRDAAADYLGEATAALGPAGSLPSAMEIARLGMEYVGNRRDLTWLRLASNDLQRREQEDPEYPGLPLDSAERRELAEVAASLPLEHRRGIVNVFPVLASRDEAVRQWAAFPVVQTLWAGDFRAALSRWEDRAAHDEREGRIDSAATWLAYVARCRLALGDLAGADDAYKRGVALSVRLPRVGNAAYHLSFYSFERCTAWDDGWAEHGAAADVLVAQAGAWSLVYTATTRVSAAVVAARLGQTQRAMDLLATLLGPLDRAPAWSPHYTAVACNAATTLWSLECAEHIDVIERNLREKVIAADFRYPMRDARLSLARLCAVQNRYDEAVEWFAQARTVLDEQGARPLRAIVDYDEALTYRRRADATDGERAKALLHSATEQFRSLGMIGWITRAECLQHNERESALLSLGATAPGLLAPALQPLTYVPTERAVFRKEGEYWTISFDGGVARLKDAKGLHYIAHLLHNPGQEFHVSELIAAVGTERSDHPAHIYRVPPGPGPRARLASVTCDDSTSVKRGLGDAGPVLDAKAKAAYKCRLNDLRKEAEEAERFNDPGRIVRARAEMESLTAELAAAVGLGGRDRVAASSAERARLAVTKRIKAALKKIRDANPSLARHLTGAISTGYFCAYAPKADVLTSWSA